jgi:hypothetical protein
MGTYYVYYSYEPWGKGYIGSRTRSINVSPEDDIYYGSFSDKTFNPTEKIILGVYNTAEEAISAEIALHEFFNVVPNPHFANRSKQTSTGFCTSGLKRTEEFKKKTSERMTGKKPSDNARKKSQERMLNRNPMKDPDVVQKVMSNRRSYSGEANIRNKLTKEDCVKIRDLKAEGLLTNKQIADLFEVSVPTVKRVNRPCHWSQNG